MMSPIHKYFGLDISPPIKERIVPNIPILMARKYPTPEPNSPVLTKVPDDENDIVVPIAMNSKPNTAKVIKNILI